MASPLSRVPVADLLAELSTRLPANPTAVTDDQIVSWVSVVAKVYVGAYYDDIHRALDRIKESYLAELTGPARFTQLLKATAEYERTHPERTAR